MPSKLFHASFGAKALWIAGTTNELENFKSSCSKITSRMIKQGGTKGRNKHYLYKIYGCNFEVFISFSSTRFDFKAKLIKATVTNN